MTLSSATTATTKKIATLSSSSTLLLLLLLVATANGFRAATTSRRKVNVVALRQQHRNRDFDAVADANRRKVWAKTASQAASLGLGAAALAVWTRPAWASSRSRSEGYAVQKSPSEWQSRLSRMQFYVLREGGTERPGYSVLEGEDRPGQFRCAGCDTPLFDSKSKFHSGTGWPSFARGLDGVEVEAVDPITATLGGGAELRCKTCGGHLGDVFNDGFLFVGTEAAKTGKRYCIDGAALVFYPESGEDAVRGDQQATKTA